MKLTPEEYAQLKAEIKKELLEESVAEKQSYTTPSRQVSKYIHEKAYAVREHNTRFGWGRAAEGIRNTVKETLGLARWEHLRSPEDKDKALQMVDEIFEVIGRYIR